MHIFHNFTCPYYLQVWQCSKLLKMSNHCVKFGITIFLHFLNMQSLCFVVQIDNTNILYEFILIYVSSPYTKKQVLLPSGQTGV